ncbi:MAG: hypothetical protein ACRDHF_07320 [Tepidiformaceae bacterium]
MWTTNYPTTEEGRGTYELSVSDVPPPLPYDVRVNVGEVDPARDFEIVLVVPEDYLRTLPPNLRPVVLALVASGGPDEALEEYEELASVYDPVAKVVRAQVPRRAVGPPRLDDNTREALLLVAPGYGGP